MVSVPVGEPELPAWLVGAVVGWAAAVVLAGAAVGLAAGAAVGGGAATVGATAAAAGALVGCAGAAVEQAARRLAPAPTPNRAPSRTKLRRVSVVVTRYLLKW